MLFRMSILNGVSHFFAFNISLSQFGVENVLMSPSKLLSREFVLFVNEYTFSFGFSRSQMLSPFRFVNFSRHPMTAQVGQKPFSILALRTHHSDDLAWFSRNLHPPTFSSAETGYVGIMKETDGSGHLSQNTRMCTMPQRRESARWK